jgi:MoaA/NifB/PqqE/SkfB family radical SAM enzyme
MNEIKKMNIISKLHQKFVVDTIQKTDWKKGTTNPLIVELDPTAVCNLACPGCISEDIIATKNSFSNQRLLELGKEFKNSGVKGVIFIGGGEPLAHLGSGELIKYLGNNDISVGITTNGVYIDRYMKEIALYSNWTRVSVDAATDKMFKILRPTKSGESKFKHVVDNMRKLSKIKKGKLGFSFLIRTEAEGDGMVSNVHEIYDAAVLAKDIGCDYFEIKPSYNYKNNIAHSLVKHSKERIEQIKEQLSKLQDLVSEDFSIVKAITLDDSLTGVKKKQVKSYHFCPATQLRTLVTPVGTFVCPYWRGKDDFNIGNAKTTEFSQLWSAKQRQKVENWLDPSVHCASLHCLRHETNLEIIKMIEDIKNGKTIEIVDEFDRFI